MELGYIYFLMGIFYALHFKNKKYEGVGKYVWSDNSLFIGQFRNDLKDEFGSWQKSGLIHPYRYEGFYHNDAKQGFGRYTCQDGGQYISQFRNEKRNGIGEMIWSNAYTFI